MCANLSFNGVLRTAFLIFAFKYFFFFLCCKPHALLELCWIEALSGSRNGFLNYVSGGWWRVEFWLKKTLNPRSETYPIQPIVSVETTPNRAVMSKFVLCVAHCASQSMWKTLWHLKWCLYPSCKKLKKLITPLSFNVPFVMLFPWCEAVQAFLNTKKWTVGDIVEFIIFKTWI